MTIKYPVAHIAESISHVLAGRLIDYAEGRVKQSGHALLSDARVTVTRQGADPRYAVSWFDHNRQNGGRGMHYRASGAQLYGHGHVCEAVMHYDQTYAEKHSRSKRKPHANFSSGSTNVGRHPRTL